MRKKLLGELESARHLKAEAEQERQRAIARKAKIDPCVAISADANSACDSFEL